jgi:hypothetical protein
MPSVIIMFFTVTVAYLLITVNGQAPGCGQARISSFAKCTATVMTDGCEDSTLNLQHTEFAGCESVQFFWSYPQYNLTMIIASPFTKQKEAFTVYLENQEVRSGVNKIFRVYKGQETDVTTSDNILVQYSDADYLCILKFIAPERLQRYGVNVNWEVKKQ